MEFRARAARRRCHELRVVRTPILTRVAEDAPEGEPMEAVGAES